MKKIRCAFISSYYGPYYSNYVASILALEKKMQEKGYYSIYIFPKEVETFNWIHLLQKETNHIYFIEYAPKTLNNLLELRKIFKTEKINLIYSRMCGWDFTSHFAMPLLPIIWHMDLFVNVVDRKKKIKNWLKFHILGFGKTYHIAVSYPLGDVINSLKPKNKCVTIPNAIDFSRLELKSEQREISYPVKLLVFGWAPQVKGLDTVLKACEIINSNYTNVLLYISSQENTYKYVENLYQTKPGWLVLIPPTDTVSDLYNNTDIMISASRSESFSYCLAEAIYTGNKVVYSDIPGTSWANEFRNLVVFKTADVNDLVRAIETSISLDYTKKDIEYNRQLMIKRYSMNTWTDKVIEYLEEIIG